MITIGSNSLHKELCKLKQRKYREHQGSYLVEGVHLVEEALQWSRSVKQLVITQELLSRIAQTSPAIADHISGDKLPVATFSQQQFSQLADTQSPQGIIAVVGATSDEEAQGDFDGDILVLNNIQDPGNLGTLIRTADAAGFRQVLLTKGSVDPYNPKVLRSAMGSHFHLDLGWITDQQAFVQRVMENNFQLVVAHVAGAVDMYQAVLDKQLALVLGNEGQGPDEFWVTAATQLVKIPLLGRAESLNVAVAGGVLLYEVVRQKGFDPS